MDPLGQVFLALLQTHLNSLVSMFYCLFHSRKAISHRISMWVSGNIEQKKNIYGDDIIPRKDSPQKPEIFNPLVKNTKTSSPKHHDLIRNFIQLFHLVTPSQGEKGQSYFSQIWMTDTPQAAASDISLGNWNFSKKLESVLPSGLSCIFYFHRINILLPSTVILFSFLCFFFLYYYIFFIFRNIRRLSLGKYMHKMEVKRTPALHVYCRPCNSQTPVYKTPRFLI